MKDLNREVAEKIMWPDEAIGHPHWFRGAMKHWNPLEDLNQCFEVVEKLDEEWMIIRTPSKSFRCIIGIKAMAKGKTPNEAILKAALEALK